MNYSSTCQRTFSVGGGVTSTVSASLTLKGSPTMVRSVENNLPLLDAVIKLSCCNNNYGVRKFIFPYKFVH